MELKDTDPWLILHVPHSSREIPEEIVKTFSLSKNELDRQLDKLTDHFTDELFTPISPEEVMLRFPISRFAVDPERFLDDKKEVMVKYGQGVFYTKTVEGKEFRHNPHGEQRKELSEKYYIPHHMKLEKLVENALEIFGKAVIIDCHSFPAEPLPMDLNKLTPRPDICLGTDSIHTSELMITSLEELCGELGWSVKVNNPYKGTMVPLKYYNKDSRVQSVMIEVNRNLYLKNDADGLSGNSEFESIKEKIRMLIDRIKMLN